MDKKDKILLYELSKNSRAPYSQLAKAMHTSQETARYRVKRLEKEGVIKKFMILTNVKALGFSVYQIFLKLQNVREEDKREMIANLMKNDHIGWVASFEGNYDLGFIVDAKDQIELQRIINNLYENFSNKIMNKTVSLILEGEFFPRDYWVYTKRPISKTASYKSVNKKINLDEIDKRICSFLADNARLSLVDIGEKIKLSADAVAIRLKRMVNIGFVTSFTADINLQKVGLMHYKILLHLNDLSEKKLQPLLNLARNNLRVTGIMKTLASWDYEINLDVENTSQLKQFTMELTTQFSDIIKEYEILQIVERSKYLFYLPSFNN